MFAWFSERLSDSVAGGRVQLTRLIVFVCGADLLLCDIRHRIVSFCSELNAREVGCDLGEVERDM